MRTRRRGPRPRIWLRLGCTECSIPLLAAVAALAVLVLAGCGGGYSPAAGPPRPTTASSATASTGQSLPPGVKPGPTPGTYYMDCSVAQCTTQPGAGPFGTTCTEPSTGEQLCAPAQASARPPPAPAPVSTTATLTGTCNMGYELNTGSNQDASGVFLTGKVPAGDVHGDNSVPDPILAYQVALTNNSGATAQVTGFGVAFYDASGAEDGSDQESASGLITQGQSLSWTVIEDHTVHGYGDDSNQEWAQTAAIPPGAATCQFVAWS